MSGLEKLKGERLQTRKIEIRTFLAENDEGDVIIEGRLDDERYVPIHTSSDRALEPGRVHGIEVRLLVGGAPPRIKRAEAEMTTVPFGECPEALHRVGDLAGVAISYGYGKEVNARLGGARGCQHLKNLVLAMGPAAIMGWATRQRLEPVLPDYASFMLEYIKDSCVVWREDGEIYAQAEAQAKSAVQDGR